VPGASFAVVWGNMDTGPFGAFVKFGPGAKFANHSHSSQLRIAVIKGAYLYKSVNGEEHRAGPGCFIATPAADHHWSGGDPKQGALMYVESNGKYDLIPDQK
jgi:quercetin dioxygenase-like cupin family protein